MADLVGPARPVQPAGTVPDGFHRDPVVLGEDTADPDGRRELVFRHADDAPGEVGRFADAAARVHVDPVVPEGPGGEDRDRDERRVLAEADHVGGEGELGRVELAETRHAEEGLLDRQVQVGQLDAVRPDVAGRQGQGPVVIPARQGQWHPHAHPASLLRPPRRGTITPGVGRPPRPA